MAELDEGYIQEMQDQADADEIRTDAHGAAYWRETGKYLGAGYVELLSCTDFPFSPEATEKARKLQAALALASYWQATKRDEDMELKVAPDRSITVVNLITGDRIRL